MRHLTTDIGWPVIVLCIVVLVAAAHALVAWVKFELRLSRRASRVGAHEAREGWPYW
jgi:hypothetical protein